MSCELRWRKDDIPKIRKREKSWVCERCSLLIMATTKPVCRRVMLAKVKALHASAEADTIERENTMTEEQTNPKEMPGRSIEELMLEISERFAPGRNGIVGGIAAITLFEWQCVFYAYQSAKADYLPKGENKDENHEPVSD